MEIQDVPFIMSLSRATLTACPSSCRFSVW